jgi:hypothetical protein
MMMASFPAPVPETVTVPATLRLPPVGLLTKMARWPPVFVTLPL